MRLNYMTTGNVYMKNVLFSQFTLHQIKVAKELITKGFFYKQGKSYALDQTL